MLLLISVTVFADIMDMPNDTKLAGVKKSSPLTIHILKVSSWRSTLVVSPTGYVTLINAGGLIDGKVVAKEQTGITIAN